MGEWTIRETGNIWVHKTQDDDNQNKKHNTIWVVHHYTQDTRPRQTKQKTQHNMGCTLLYVNKHKYRLTSKAFTLSILLTKDTCLKDFTFEICTITQP
jgi:hypothetical protein